jgi:hypothetical protein
MSFLGLATKKDLKVQEGQLQIMRNSINFSHDEIDRLSNEIQKLKGGVKK